MATEKVGVYRKWHGPIPVDASGQPLPQKQWANKRPCAWAVRWFGGEGKRYSKSFDTRKEADRFAESKQQDVRQGKPDPPERITLREFYWDHKKLMTAVAAETTLHMQLATLALLADGVGWQCDLKRISSRDIEKFRAERAATGNAAMTVNKEIKTLKTLFYTAIRRGYLATGQNPAVGIALAKVGKRRIPYCPIKDFELIFGQAGSVLWRALLAVIYGAGLRKREALHLTWSDVDFEEGKVYVNRHDAVGFVQKWSPKDHELRSIPLPQSAIDLLVEWQAMAPEKCPYIFMDPERWAYYRQQVQAGKWKRKCDLVNNVLRRFKTLCKRAKVARYTIHDLRRTCITNWARENPMHVTQELAGHDDINTTKDYYLSVRAEDLAKVQKAQTHLMAGLKDIPLTDPKLTQKTRKREFPKRKVFAGVPKPPETV